jgi:uncharacterized membrane protein
LTPQAALLLSCIAFIATHFLLSHPLRRPLVRAMGEGPFRAVYSLIAVLTFGAMVYFYRKCGREPPDLWQSGEAAWIAGTILMWIASILFVGSFMKNPSLVGSRGPAGGPTGVLRLTRHPMMWSFAIWAAVHLMILGQPTALVFDATIIIMALGGAAAQDRKKGGGMGEDWHDWAAETAFVPFTRGLAYPGTAALVGGTFLFLIATWLHPFPAGIWRWIS